MGSNWSLSHHIPMERYQFRLLMLRQPQIGSYRVAIILVRVVLQQGIWNPMTWGGIHLLQAGEPGQNGDCYCELNVQITTICICWWVLLSLNSYVEWSCMHELLSEMLVHASFMDLLYWYLYTYIFLLIH